MSGPQPEAVRETRPGHDTAERAAIISAVADLISAGAKMGDAAKDSGTTARTIQRWMKVDSDYAAAIQGALAKRGRYSPATLKSHGTAACWQRGCRCDLCRAANAVRFKKMRTERAGNQIPEHVTHGTLTCYRNWGCRCDPCTNANTLASRPAYERWLERHPGRLNELERRSYRSRQARTLEMATRYGYQWTGPELEIAGRPDLSAYEVARMLRRTYAAVRHMRRKLREDPKIINLAGLARPAP